MSGWRVAHPETVQMPMTGLPARDAQTHASKTLKRREKPPD